MFYSQSQTVSDTQRLVTGDKRVKSAKQQFQQVFWISSFVSSVFISVGGSICAQTSINTINTSINQSQYHYSVQSHQNSSSSGWESVDSYIITSQYVSSYGLEEQV